MDEVARLLHELRLRGSAPLADGAATQETLVAAGFASRRGERLVLTPEGRRRAEDQARIPSGTDAAQHAARAYAAFRPLNPEVVRVCHDWQTVGDWSVVGRLGTLDDRVGPIVRRLGRDVERFSDYRARLRDARRRVEAGESEWFTSPRCDSYHTVWMQLHEDLLLALGLDRAAETQAEAEAEAEAEA